MKTGSQSFLFRVLPDQLKSKRAHSEGFDLFVLLITEIKNAPLGDYSIPIRQWPVGHRLDVGNSAKAASPFSKQLYNTLIALSASSMQSVAASRPQRHA
jgi:hypothetical protein